MRKITIALIGLVFIMSSTGLAQEMTLEKILDKHFETIGISKLLKVNTITIKGKLIQQGMEFPGTFYQKRPNKIYVEFVVQGQSIKQAYNGEKGWQINPLRGITEPQDMNDEETESIKENADIEGPLYKWKEKGHTAELIGKEDMEGTEVYKIKLTLKPAKEGEEGKVSFYYIDTESFMILMTATKRITQGVEVLSEIYTGNFKSVDGMISTHSMETKMRGNTVMQIVVDEIVIDKEIEDSIFEKPTK